MLKTQFKDDIESVRLNYAWPWFGTRHFGSRYFGKNYFAPSGQIFKTFVHSINIGLLDETHDLQTAVMVALGTDKLADIKEVLPDPDSTDRRGWWGDMDAEEIWGGWPVGTRAWLLLRAKISDAISLEGATLERARLYTQEALQPFIDHGVASAVTVSAARTELERIEVLATIYRGPLEEIELKYQPMWQDIRNE
jgi:phage gp46-like protein